MSSFKHPFEIALFFHFCCIVHFSESYSPLDGVALEEAKSTYSRGEHLWKELPVQMVKETRIKINTLNFFHFKKSGLISKKKNLKDLCSLVEKNANNGNLPSPNYLCMLAWHLLRFFLSTKFWTQVKLRWISFWNHWMRKITIRHALKSYLNDSTKLLFDIRKFEIAMMASSKWNKIARHTSHAMLCIF